MPKTARAVVLGSLGTVAIVAPANAQTVEFPQTTSQFNGALCWGNIRTWADTSPDYPGRAVLNVQALPISGIGPGQYPLAPLCDVDTTVAWRNMSTGVVGEYRVNVVAGLYGSMLYAMFQDTGPGRVDVVVTTNALNAPVHGTFDVPGPPPGQ
ncbi:hypothetical protein [Nocardia pseudobrasiliensis]|uniref:Uncharacterized protein n=1 Tax=Nocardia pseudobrasiliensis TaxID=45979 RepID=A0A370I8F8_9NOCA|nr:hypothetical protein [Nocardia pseudobrasiliensis]RDI66890.1 hypothetical protein DFR76_104643 [Nocardia pseudobrasiliensis]